MPDGALTKDELDAVVPAQGGTGIGRLVGLLVIAAILAFVILVLPGMLGVLPGAVPALTPTVVPVLPRPPSPSSIHNLNYEL